MEAMASCSNTPRTQTEVLTEEPSNLPVLHLRLERPRNERRVVWREGTIDNEHMGKKKSKCCCIYKKPLQFGESSSESDDECENCFGHPEKRRKNQQNSHPDTNDGQGDEPSSGHKCDSANH